MTNEQIERHVEKKTDRIDAWFMDGKFTQEEYDIAVKNLNTWADYQYEHATVSAWDTKQPWEAI